MTSVLPLMTVSQLSTISSKAFLNREAFIDPTVYPLAWGVVSRRCGATTRPDWYESLP